MMLDPLVVARVRVPGMVRFVSPCVPRFLVCEVLTLQRRLMRERGRQAERRQDGNSEYC